MNVPVANPQVTAFVEAVRAELSDLSAEERDELTDGLEADLVDALSDSGAPPEKQLSDPVDYAAELRSAAGLPPRAGSSGEERQGAAARVQALVAERRDAVLRQPWWPDVRAFLVTLRPVWWVLRALVAAATVSWVFGGGQFLLALIAVVISVEVGRRGLAAQRPGWRSAVVVANGIAVVALLLVFAPSPGRLLDAGRSTDQASGSSDPSGDGLRFDGDPVRNVFPYDSQGRPLTGIQLFDQEGRPLTVGADGRLPVAEGQELLVEPVPAVDAAGVQRWNVYPLRQQVRSVNGTDGSDPSLRTVPPSGPSAVPSGVLPPSASLSPSPSPSPSPSASPSPSRSVSPSPSASPSGTR